MTSDALLFPVADALQMALHQIGEGYKASATRNAKISGWTIPLDLHAKSDVLEDALAAFFVKVRGDLWMYIVSQPGDRLYALVFSAAVAKIAPGFMATACGQGTAGLTLKRLNQAGAITYQFDAKEAAWKASDAPLSL